MMVAGGRRRVRSRRGTVEGIEAVLEALESVAHERGESVEGNAGEVHEAVFHVGPQVFDRVRFGRVGGPGEHRQPGACVDRVAHLVGNVGVQAVPPEHDRCLDQLVHAVDEGDVISMPLALEAPGHWLTAVWELACWQVGLVIDLTNPTVPVAVVTGRNWEGHAARDVFACALDPMGFGFGEPLPDGIRDYAVEVRRHGDRFFGPPPDGEATAWVDAERTLTQADLVKVDGPPARRLVRAREPWTTCRDGVATALVTGGSAVVVVGADADQVARIAESERVHAP